MPRTGMPRSAMFVLALVVTGCGAGDVTTTDDPVPAVGSLDAQRPPDPNGYRVHFETTAGDFVVEVHPEWAPEGAARFRELVEQGLYDGNRFFRAVPGFVVQWGIHGDPEVSAQWRGNTIPDDPVIEGNTRGRITFATSGKDSRTTQVFVSLQDNSSLDDMGFAAFGEVVEGMDIVESLYDEYGDGPPSGRGPNQQLIQNVGEPYLAANFPELDKIERAVIVETEEPEPAPAPTTDN
jgi:peptidyl-prolyl cis-trans isomerase A (cyclophilin A)